MSQGNPRPVEDTRPPLTEEEFIARCRAAFKAGLITRPRLACLERYMDFAMRFVHTMCSNGQTQGDYVIDFLIEERERVARANGGRRTLAGDDEAYAMIQFAACLSHHCQECATDPQAWWTRPAFCPHKKLDKPEEPQALPDPLC